MCRLHAAAMKLIRHDFDKFDIEHVRRELNKDADKLANSAIDLGTRTNDYYSPSDDEGDDGKTTAGRDNNRDATPKVEKPKEEQ